MVTSKKALKYIYILISLICAFVCIFGIRDSDNNAYFNLAIVLLINFASFVIINGITTGKLFNFSTIFIFLLFLFNFGQVFLVAFFDTNDVRIVLYYFEQQEAIMSLKYIFYAVLATSIGCMISARSNVNKTNYSFDYKTEKKLLDIIIMTTFPIKLVIDIVFVYLSFANGFAYGVQWLSSFPNVIITLGNFSFFAFAGLLFLEKNNHKKQLMLFLFLLLYLVVLMSVGRRSENVAHLCVFIFVFFSTRISKNNKLNLITYLLIAILGYFVFTFLYAVVNSRQTNNSLLYVLNNFDRIIKEENIIIQVLREYGNTGYTAICVITKWLPNYPISFGKSYTLGLSAIFPNIGGVAGNLTTASAFAIDLQTHNALTSGYTNIGGSIIGEAFFNFGIPFGILFMLAIGLLVGSIDKSVLQSLSNGDVKNLVFAVPCMFMLLYWIRDSFCGNIRDVVWFCLFYYFMRSAFIKKDILLCQKH